MNYYHRGHFYGKSSSGIFYQLSAQLNRNNKDSLWWWIVGLSTLQLHNKAAEIDNDEIMSCNDEVVKLHPAQVSTQAVAKDTSLTADYKERNTFDLVTLKNHHNEVGTITIEQELKMTLLRHWTLYDSICNSNYLVSNLQIGREPGNKKLKQFLIDIGVTIEQSQQKYQYMNLQLKDDLKNRIIEKADVHGVKQILISSFLRQMTPSLQVSAFDAAYAVSALLEYPHHINEFNEQNTRTPNEPVKKNQEQENINQRNQHKQMQEQVQKDQMLENLNSCLHDNFWIAYDALEFKKADTLLLKGISAAKEMQQAIVRVGTSLVERKEVKVADYFRYVILDNDYLADVKLF
jgi:cell division control protein 45